MQRYRASSLFQPSDFAAALGSGNDGSKEEFPGTLIGVALLIPHTQIARNLAILGFDFIFVDTLHAPITTAQLVDIIHFISFASDGKTCAVVRIQSPESDLLAPTLDAGAAAIVFPQIDTPAQAAAAVKKVRYAYAGGERSVSPIALINGFSNMAPPGWTSETIADRNIAVICQIESTLACENVDAIAATPGLDGLMLGAADLRASLGLPCRNPPGQGDDVKFIYEVKKLIAASKKHKVPLLGPAFSLSNEPGSIEYLRHFKMIVVSVDMLNIVKAALHDLAFAKDLLAKDQAQRESNGDVVKPPDSEIRKDVANDLLAKAEVDKDQCGMATRPGGVTGEVNE
ncbi:hypothetical protein LMH87_006724 [Akanthomyces muscarius]|uniref:HpcH/HpaI aldolase/citrate lyase domain-containing protein n=1 Tax=Akanthomyces muscarius TaxID=2231603 RepID=A0A9W8QRQ2_AKAMU|nr:hypothetical protein LMH87_006724 [Akanthomyces muscarius]KAJ4165077.1 hypothetical protein LMH87_006724 [Akanthomyces muscarius]